MIDAIVVPQGAEYKAVCRGVEKDQHSSLTVVSIPIGFNQTKVAATVAYLKSLNVERLVIMGLCGSLSEQYSVGDVVLYQSCFDPHQQITLKTAQELTTTIHHYLPSASLVTSYTSDRVINLASEKQQLYRTYQTDVVDMEGFSYLQLLQSQNIAVAILRVISDDPQHDIPDLTQAINDQGQLKILSLTVVMIKHPLAAIQLIKGSLKGLKKLEKTVEKLNLIASK